VIKFTTYILFLPGFIFFMSCGQAELCSQQVKTLDSLNGAVNGMAKELEKADTVTLQKAMTRFNYYRQFIQQNIHDTITKNEADNLQHFYVSGKTLDNFSINRRSILARASLVNSQLAKLTSDAKKQGVGNGAINRVHCQRKSRCKRVGGGRICPAKIILRIAAGI